VRGSAHVFYHLAIRDHERYTNALVSLHVGEK
jgi:hypothetical protein